MKHTHKPTFVSMVRENNPQQDTVKEAMGRLAEIPGITPRFNIINNTAALALKPTCTFEDKQSADAFGEELSGLCFRRFQKMTPHSQPVFSSHYYNGRYEVTLNIATTTKDTPPVDGLSPASLKRLDICMTKIERNAMGIAELMQRNGVSMGDFKGITPVQKPIGR